MNDEKQLVHDFWNRASCGEELYLAGTDIAAYDAQATIRYELEPYIREFAGFDATHGMKVLEIGVGMGADHERFAQAGAEVYGIDLTNRAVAHTRTRLGARALRYRLIVGDAEALCFPANTFDLVYSWGVLHHTPDPSKAVLEVQRVLRPGGVLRIMLYHKWSLVGVMLWLRYALLALRPWLTMTVIYARHLESPDTKAYSISEARRLFSNFKALTMHVTLSHGDLLQSSAGQRHRGWMLTLARKLWPRAVLRRFFSRFGLFILIEARKDASEEC